MARGYNRDINGDVILTMSSDDFSVLMMALGTAMAISREDRGIPLSILVPVVNHINQGNPAYTPYEERAQ